MLCSLLCSCVVVLVVCFLSIVGEFDRSDADKSKSKEKQKRVHD